jgi:pyruvate dehydrogenase E1 component beta subunit
MAEMRYREALNAALREELKRDERVLLMGEDIGVFGGAFKVTDGLLEEFGERRIRDTPISENTIVGIGVGAAMVGLRPVVELMTINFSLLAFDQIVNHAAHIHYMFGGQVRVPLVVRMPQGAGHQLGPTHSHCLEALFLHVPGLLVAVPATAADAKGLLKTAIRDENPVIFFEDKMMYKLKGPVPAEDYTIPLGVADVKRKGEDITLVATSSMVQVALGAATLLEKAGISAEVVDPRTTWPLDEKTIIDSAKKTSRVIVLDEGYGRYGVTAELAAVIAEGAFYDLDTPVKRMGAMHVPIPFSPPLEDVTVPTEETVFNTARSMCSKS